MSSYKNIMFEHHGMLTPIRFVGYSQPNKYGQRHALWLCRCDCGNHVTRTSDVILRDKSSCGCRERDHLRDMANGNVTHGASKTGAYRSYKAMMSRCYRKNDMHYHTHGGRGITVCDEWRNNSSAFIEWAFNNGWKEHLTLERIDNNGNYEPSNCKWIPLAEQAENRRQNIMVTYCGETHSCARWARILGLVAKDTSIFIMGAMFGFIIMCLMAAAGDNE